VDANNETNHPQSDPSGQRAVRATDNAPGDMVCVTLGRPPHFWRFACSAGETGELLERLAHLADDGEHPLSWDDAEMIASELLVHHHLDAPSGAPPKDR